jgi:NAD(P)-dependent dehydrogenase (short-subunit alcohol dehydrogenase family)
MTSTPQSAMSGRTCIVTGATSGIGRMTAFGLARLGATLGLVCRDRARAEATVAEIARETGNRDVSVFIADLSSQAEIRRVAAELLARYPAIHVLVNNAGVVHMTYSTTVDGIETVFAVNHLAYFLLTELLLERLTASAPARIVNVASDAHKFTKGIDFDDLGHEKSYSWIPVYGQSKLANVLFTRELARRLEGTGVTVNSLHPGAVATGLGKNNGRLATFLIKLLSPFFRSPERGAETSVYLATDPAVANVSGRYFAKCREARPSAAASDVAVARRLWEVSERLTRPTPQSASGAA